MHEHCLAAWQGFKWLGYEIIFSENWLPTYAKPGDPIVGTVEFIQNFFTSRSYPTPPPLNVPVALLPFAGRTIERETLGNVVYNRNLPLFLKPADSHKLFTGGVIETSSNAKLIFSGIDLETPVLVSPEIQIESEYRVFVSRDKGMMGIKHYAGDPFVVPSAAKIQEMIRHYGSTAPRAYSLDVGIVGHSEAETIVVECNDFWALGTYGFDPVKYAELLALRWHEMITQLTA